MVVVKMAILNLWRNKSRTFTIGSFAAVTTAFLLFGNAIFDGSDSGIQSTFIESFTGDLSISPPSEQSLSIFGNQTPVTGSFAFNPILSPYPAFYDWLKTNENLLVFTPLVSGLVLFEKESFRKPSSVFGIDPSSYFSVFPAIKLEKGAFLASNERGIMIPTSRADAIKNETGHYPEINDPILLSVFSESGFQIREVPLKGIYSYPVVNPTLDAISLVDVGTMRSLYGLTLANTIRPNLQSVENEVKPGEDDTSLSSSNFSLENFLNGSTDMIDNNPQSLTLQGVENLLRDTSVRDQVLKENEGAWNFVVLRLKAKLNDLSFRESMRIANDRFGWDFQVRDWRATAGGSAQLSYWVRTIYNIGLLIVFVTGLLVVINTMTIGVSERRSEMGTIRALGAQKSFVRRLFFFESVFLLTVFGLIGVLVGAILINVVNRLGIPLNNQTLSTLFGSEVLRPMLTIKSVLSCALMSMIVGSFAWIFPVRTALKIQPTQAMLSE